MNEFMTREEAKLIMFRHSEGRPVKAIVLQTAIWTLSKRKDRMHLPKLPKQVKDMANAVLLLNLGERLRFLAERRDCGG
jgi:hypothetical protein